MRGVCPGIVIPLQRRQAETGRLGNENKQRLEVDMRKPAARSEFLATLSASWQAPFHRISHRRVLSCRELRRVNVSKNRSSREKVSLR